MIKRSGLRNCGLKEKLKYGVRRSWTQDENSKSTNYTMQDFKLEMGYRCAEGSLQNTKDEAHGNNEIKDDLHKIWVIWDRGIQPSLRSTSKLPASFTSNDFG